MCYVCSTLVHEMCVGSVLMDYCLYIQALRPRDECVSSPSCCRWLSEVHGIFFQGNKRKQIPTDRLGQFFEAVSVLMSSQLRELSLNSIASYLEMLCPMPGCSAVGLFPGFVVNVTVDGTALQFEPSQRDVEVCTLTLHHLAHHTQVTQHIDRHSNSH